MAALSRAALDGVRPLVTQEGAIAMAAPLLRRGTGEALNWMTGELMPAGFYDEMETYYQESSATESWPRLLERIAGSVCRLGKPYLAERLLSGPVAAVTVRYADVLEKHTDWQQTLMWFASQETGSNKWLATAYCHYTTVLIAYRAYQALCFEDVEQSEAALRTLARTLQDAEIVQRFPQLAPMLDLLPLIPALRQVYGQLPPATGDSWWDHADQWQTALVHADTRESRAAGARLSRCMADWLSKAAMSACHYLAYAALVPAPGANAEVIETTGAQHSRSPKAKASNSAAGLCAMATDARLASGVTLGAVGAVIMIYGLWRCMQRRPDYALVGQPRKSLYQKTLPLIIGGAALTAGGCLAYPYLKRWLTQSTEWSFMSAEERARLMLRYPEVQLMLDRQLLPDWGDFFGADEVLPTASQRMARGASEDGTADRTTSDKAGPVSMYFEDHIGALISDQTVPEWLRLETQLVLQRASEDPRVKGSLDPEVRTQCIVIRMMQSVSSTARDPSFGMTEARKKDLCRLWAILYDTAGLFLATKHGYDTKRVTELLEIGPRLEFAPAENELRSSPFTEAQTKETTRILIEAYDAILDPAFYLDKRIQEVIQDTSVGDDVAEVLSPVTLIPIIAKASSFSNPNHDRTQIQDKTFYVTVREFVTGQHFHIFKPQADSRASYSFEPKSKSAALKRLDEIDFESEMLDRLDAYQADTNRVENFRMFHAGMIIERSLAYLAAPERFPLFARSVANFLAGDHPANLLTFRGEVVTGAFCIPVTEQSALILSIDEPVFYHVFDHVHEFYVNKDLSKTISNYPKTHDFSKWVYSKVSIRHAAAYGFDHENLKNSFFSHRAKVGVLQFEFKNVLRFQPLKMSGSIFRKDLPDELMRNFFTRLRSDIDVMILTKNEVISLRLLEGLKLFLTFTQLGLSAFLPGTGTMLSITASLLVNLGLGALGVGAALAQYTIADQHVDRVNYCIDAAVGAAMTLAGFAVDGNKLLTFVLNRKLTARHIREYQAIYENLRGIFQTRFSNQAQTVGGPLHSVRPRNRLVPANAPLKRKAVDTAGSLSRAGPSYRANKPVVPGAKPTINIFDETLTRDVVAHFHYPPSVEFMPFAMAASPMSEVVGYRTIPDTDYVHIYTMQGDNPPLDESASLIVSAHGGYVEPDLRAPAIPLPADIALDLLTPHGTTLLDPTIHAVINDVNFQAYVSIKGELTKVSFLPQNHAEWLFGANYDPHNVASTHGPVKGIFNYRHIQFEDNPWVIWKAIRDNRKRAITDGVRRADVLVVNDGITDFWQSDPGRASIGKVLELDREHLLLNAHGQRYKRLIFSHCRSNFEKPVSSLPNYVACAEQLSAIGKEERNVWLRAIYKTTIIRQGAEDLFIPVVELRHAYAYSIPPVVDTSYISSPG